MGDGLTRYEALMPDILEQMLGVVVLASDLPLMLWPVSLVILLLAILSARALHRHQEMSRPIVVIIVASVAAFIGFPLHAVLFYADHHVDTPQTQEMPTTILGVLWWSYVLLVALAVYSAKGFRLPAGGLATFFLWVNVSVIIVCFMAVSGLWL